ncbi:MAG TPA: ATP synthase F0 subunit C [Verrucomicrobiales bacterium]|jgi:F-type H+-transporting ATPase subunit c|nr:ATP synthase F0 subunit C [Verrucomicrobiales bacterium]
MMDIVSMLADAAVQVTPEVLAQTKEIATSTNLNGSFTLGVAGAGAGIGIGLVGLGATQAVGRNPGAFGNILVIAIIGMALAEAIAIYALVLAFQGR